MAAYHTHWNDSFRLGFPELLLVKKSKKVLIKKIKSVGMTLEKVKEQDGMMLAKVKKQEG